MYGTQPFRQVWYDEIGIGCTFADADPDRLYDGRFQKMPHARGIDRGPISAEAEEIHGTAHVSN
jgi:hypothetical protein